MMAGDDAPPNDDSPVPKPTSQATAAAETGGDVEDPWAAEDVALSNELDRQKLDDDLGDLIDNPPDMPTADAETQEAIQKLKESSSKLGSAISSSTTSVAQKIGLTNALSSLNQNIQQVDQQTHISETVSSTAASIGSWFSSSVKQVNEQYKIGESTKQMASSVTESIDTSVVKDVFSSTTRAVQSFDAQHGLTKSTASALASGADMLTQSIATDESSSEQATTVDSTTAVATDSDGLPTSFSNEQAGTQG